MTILFLPGISSTYKLLPQARQLSWHGDDLNSVHLNSIAKNVISFLLVLLSAYQKQKIGYNKVQKALKSKNS